MCCGIEPHPIWTDNLSIWSRTRYRCYYEWDCDFNVLEGELTYRQRSWLEEIVLIQSYELIRHFLACWRVGAGSIDRHVGFSRAPE
jgi:hypothetical protein